MNKQKDPPQQSAAKGVVVDDLVFDAGAHKGEDTDFYLRMGYRVVAIEANPDLAEDLRVQFRQETENGRLIVVDKAIAGAAGEVTFYMNSRSVWGTADPQWARRNAAMGYESRQVTVPSVTFESVLQRYGCPVYVKIDIEGADMLCVEGLRSSAVKPKYLSIESNKVSWRALLAEFRLLQSLGYTRFQVVNQCTHVARTCMTRDGTSIHYSFKEGGSGAFGPYLDPNQWLTARQAILRYVPIFLRYKFLGDNTVLARVLARTPVLWRLQSAVAWYDTHAAR